MVGGDDQGSQGGLDLSFFYVSMCFLSQQEEQQQQYTSLLLTGLLAGVSR